MKLEELIKIFEENEEPFDIIEISVIVENDDGEPHEETFKGIFFDQRLKMVSDNCKKAISDGKFNIYETRHDDDSVGEIVEISDKIAVNFSGTFVCEDTIPGIESETLVSDYCYL